MARCVYIAIFVQCQGVLCSHYNGHDQRGLCSQYYVYHMRGMYSHYYGHSR
jgi:hypothetical protein